MSKDFYKTFGVFFLLLAASCLAGVLFSEPTKKPQEITQDDLKRLNAQVTVIEGRVDTIEDDVVKLKGRTR